MDYDDEPRISCKNLIRPAINIVKLIEFCFVFIVFMITRFGGGDGDMIGVGSTDSVNAEAFAYMVVFGYQFILIVQLIGIILGEGLNVQNLIYTSLGFIFYLSLGAAQISKTRQENEYNGLDDKVSNRLLMGSMCIITSFIFLADAVLIAMMEKKRRSS